MTPRNGSSKEASFAVFIKTHTKNFKCSKKRVKIGYIMFWKVNDLWQKVKK